MTGRLHAFFLNHFSPRYNRLAGDLKTVLFQDLHGRILEIGAGTGANFDFFPHGIHWTGCDPNPHARRYAMENAARQGIPADWATAPAERIPFPDDRFDAVVCSLTLCSVPQPDAVAAEVRRVLKPGSPFVFLEHVIAPEGTNLRRKQRQWRGAFRFFCGCTPDRDTVALLRQSGFARLEFREISLPIPVVGTHIAGRAFV